MNFKGTASEKNIMLAFEGESKARNKYTYYSLQASKEGHEEIAELFLKMAENEKEHAKIWFKLLNEGFGDSDANLQDAANSENYEWKSMYPDFAKQAREDGLEMLAVMFERVAAIENDHEKRFLEAYMNFKKDSSSHQETASDKPKETVYRCMFCGSTSPTHLDVCPVCEAIGSYQRVDS